MIKFDEYWNKVCISSNCEEDEARRHYEAGMMEQNNTMRLSTSPSLCGSEVMRSEFEKAYEPNPHKSPFNEVRFNEEKQIYEPLNPPLDRVARSLNAAWYGYRIRQTEVDELQKKNAWLSDVAERENKRANKLQEEEVSTTSLLGKTIQEKNELQKRVDAVKQLIEDYRDPPTEDKTFQHALSIVAYELEQALKGEKQ